MLNALLNRSWNRELGSVLQRRYVTTNHFDVDSFLSVWCYVNRQAAVEHEAGGWVTVSVCMVGPSRSSVDSVISTGSKAGATLQTAWACIYKCVFVWMGEGPPLIRG